MQGNYTLKYSNNDKKPTKILCLGFCILLDLIVLAGIIACFSTKKYIDLLIYLAIFTLSTAIRIVSLFLTYEVIVEFKGDDISIIKKYAVCKKLLYRGESANLNLKKCVGCDDAQTKKCARLCSKSCADGVYMVELLQRKYVIYLDDYLYSLIEVNSDLS